MRPATFIRTSHDQNVAFSNGRTLSYHTPLPRVDNAMVHNQRSVANSIPARGPPPCTHTGDQPRDDPVHWGSSNEVLGYFRSPGTPNSVIASRSSTASRSLPLSTPFSITSCRTVTFFATASLASFAASAYPILGARAVTRAGLRSSQ